ncbi:MAG: electron transfer flavoprotein subunit alpha [Deltaproteobacteria bacterium]|nr:electron transfer flavoprotein subunit alpha [Deltaproteobacteria bacterium]
MGIQVDLEKCDGCKKCVLACPFGAIELVEKKAQINYDECTLCGACANACEYEAIVIERGAGKGTENIEEYKGVMVFAEQHDGEMKGCTYELLGEGRKLADKLGEELSAILPGNKVDHLVKELFAHGADKVYLIDNETLDAYMTGPYATAVSAAIAKYKPAIVLYGATTYGRDLAPRVAARIQTGLTADCTQLDIDEENRLLLQTRPAFGGNIMATIKCPRHRPQMSTVRPKVMKMMEPDDSREGELVKMNVEINKKSAKTKILEIIKEVKTTGDIEEADIIVTGGWGMGAPENFKLLEDLANALGGAVGATRAAVDAEWQPQSNQVGQTGKTVCPKLYIACGVSGAVQHLVGMQTSDYIIAINKDPDAPIFSVANCGIVGDVFQIVPELTKEVQKLLA